MGAPGVLSATPAALAAALAHELRPAGVTVAPGQVQRFAASLRLVRWDDRDELYWTARTTLVSAAEELPAFEAVFGALVDGLPRPAADRGGAAPGLLGDPRMSPRRDDGMEAGAQPGEGTAALPVRLPAAAGDDDAGSLPPEEAAPTGMSAEERLGDRDFAGLTDEELDEVRALVDRITLVTPLRRTRRTRPRANGCDVDMRRTLRRAGRSGGEPVRIARRARRDRPRRLVLLCDVSGSMAPYTRVFLGLLQGAVGSAGAEAFVFGTRLTRVTGELRGSDSDIALARAARRASDMAGGTRLGASLRDFLDSYGRRGMARGAVLVIMSDGWTSDADIVAEQMARLRRLCHRIVWVNPRSAAPAYEPRAAGMAAGLPYCDALVSGHSLRSLDDVTRAVGGRRQPARPGRAASLDA